VLARKVALMPRRFEDVLERLGSDHGELVRFSGSERSVRRAVGLPARTEDDEREDRLVRELRFRNPTAFSVWVSYLAWRQMPQLEEGYVLLAELEENTRNLSRRFMRVPAILEAVPPTSPEV
jgi:hypothetical protein